MKKSIKKIWKAVPVILLISLCSISAAGPTYSFTNITNNNTGDAAIGEAQLSVELFDLGNSAQFVFSNSGPLSCSITDVYFDDGSNSIFATMIDFSDIDNSDPGVAFSPIATPGNLPGGSAAPWYFSTTAGLSADSDAPIPLNGVNPGETVGLTLTFANGANFTDLLNEMASGDLRIGLHVQGFASGGSEAFINNGGGIAVVPVPGALLLSGIGTLIVGVLRRRQKV